MGFEKDFLEFDEEDKEKILYSENPNVHINKKYEKVDFSKLDDLRFETNKPSDDFDLLDIDHEPNTTTKQQPVYEKDEDSDSDVESDSKEYSDSGFGNPEEPGYAPFEDRNGNDDGRSKKVIVNADSDDFLNY